VNLVKQPSSLRWRCQGRLRGVRGVGARGLQTTAQFRVCGRWGTANIGAFPRATVARRVAGPAISWPAGRPRRVRGRARADRAASRMTCGIVTWRCPGHFVSCVLGVAGDRSPSVPLLRRVIANTPAQVTANDAHIGWPGTGSIGHFTSSKCAFAALFGVQCGGCVAAKLLVVTVRRNGFPGT
jgi:hypothetical protein